MEIDKNPKWFYYLCCIYFGILFYIYFLVGEISKYIIKKFKIMNIRYIRKTNTEIDQMCKLADIDKK